MTIVWTDSAANVDWQELEALYRAAPLGDKNAADLQVVFGNSMFCCFAYDGNRLVGAGRVLADGRDCAYLCDIAVLLSSSRSRDRTPRSSSIPFPAESRFMQSSDFCG
jgi:hypothetical protein